MDDGEDELVIDQTGPDFMLDQLENYMNLSVFSDLSVQCKEKLISSAHCAVLSAVSPFLKKLFAYHRGLAHTAGQPVTILLPEASFADVSRLLQLVYLGRVNFHSAVEKKSFAELLQMLCISEKILVRTECSQVAAAAVTEQEEDQVEEESDNIVAVADDEDEDDADMMCLEPQTEMTVEGEDDDEESEGSDGGEEVNWNSGPPSVTLHPASTPLQRAKLDLPPSVSITRNPRPVTATITPAGNFRQAKVDREDLDRRTREFLDAQNDPAPGMKYFFLSIVKITEISTITMMFRYRSTTKVRKMSLPPLPEPEQGFFEPAHRPAHMSLS
jgi:hypothetical protein